MRTKQLIQGLNNTQKIRFMINGFGMYCQVQDVVNICTTDYRAPVWMALDRLGNENFVAKYQGKPPISGYGARICGYDVQVDLV